MAGSHVRQPWYAERMTYPEAKAAMVRLDKAIATYKSATGAKTTATGTPKHCSTCTCSIVTDDDADAVVEGGT